MLTTPSRLPGRCLLCLAFALAWPLALAGCGEDHSAAGPAKQDPEAVKAQQTSIDFMKSQSKKPAAKK